MRTILWFIEDYLTPASWSRKWRRFFIVTLPISGPLYLISAALIIILLLCAMPIFGLGAWIGEMWDNPD